MGVTPATRGSHAPFANSFLAYPSFPLFLTWNTNTFSLTTVSGYPGYTQSPWRKIPALRSADDKRETSADLKSVISRVKNVLVAPPRIKCGPDRGDRMVHFRECFKLRRLQKTVLLLMVSADNTDSCGRVHFLRCKVHCAQLQLKIHIRWTKSESPVQPRAHRGAKVGKFHPTVFGSTRSLRVHSVMLRCHSIGQ